MSEIKVNKISPRTNCGTVTLGDSGDTITIPSGATITNNGTAAGFGSTGEISWDTTPKTASFTGVSGVGYFINTTSGVITVTLPASPSAGNVIGVSDYNSTATTNNITIARNSSNINGSASDLIISKANSAIQLVYVDSTTGWQSVFSGNVSDLSNPYLVATGGTQTTCGDYKIHTFTGPGTFTVTKTAIAANDNVVDYLVAAGGGSGPTTGGGDGISGGGGAGGFRFYANTSNNPQSGPGAPINNFPSGTSITVSQTSFPIAVGAGGAITGPVGNPGSNSTFSTITSTGGGRGGRGDPNAGGQPGGSGGGGDNGVPNDPGGSGNTPPTNPPQGKDGARGGNSSAGGGGGAIAAGSVGSTSGGNGGAGAGITGFGSSNGECSSCVQYFSGGGGGGNGNANFPSPGIAGTGGLGGGGDGITPACAAGPAEAGTANTGGGGGGASDYNPGGAFGGTGGSGIVIIRYKFQ